MTHICVSKLSIIGSDNGLSPDRRQAIIWTNAGIFLIGNLKQTSMKFYSKFMHFHSRISLCKCRLENGGHLVSASMCQPFRDKSQTVTEETLGHHDTSRCHVITFRFRMPFKMNGDVLSNLSKFLTRCRLMGRRLYMPVPFMYDGLWSIFSIPQYSFHSFLLLW